MTRYIDADFLIEQLQPAKNDERNKRDYSKSISEMIEDFCTELSNTRTADVAEVKHGYNATSMNPVDEFVCSECGFICTDFRETVYDEESDYTYYRECVFDYCPKCGAKIIQNDLKD